MADDIIIHWFREDLRLHDNPALLAAAGAGRVLAVFVLDDEAAGEYRSGAASRWWLQQSLQSLKKSLRNKLFVYSGDAQTIIRQVAKENGARAVHWNDSCLPWRMQQDEQIETLLLQDEIQVKRCNGSLLWEPGQVLKKDATPYRVFTPFYRRGCLGLPSPREPLPAPAKMRLTRAKGYTGSLAALKLLTAPAWYRKLEAHWEVGEKAAHQRLESFLDKGIRQYKSGRNLPARAGISRLSPHLHFGELSPNQVWYAARARIDDDNLDQFCCELGWREFSHNLLYHNPQLPEKNLQPRFNAFPWRRDKRALQRWQQGQTGYPIVDAGMRELWQTGFMHNRLRMITGSFLIKNLLLHWHHGQRWFWDCLLDADLANNSAGWQWIAGCGADAAPYFRIFNPQTQGQKFDAAGEYTRRFVPELEKMPDKYLYNPWQAPSAVLKAAGVCLGKDYPEPIVEIKASRERALLAFQQTKLFAQNNAGGT